MPGRFQAFSFCLPRATVRLATGFNQWPADRLGDLADDYSLLRSLV
jgi:hypothetical protein